MSKDTVIKIENLSKQYRLGLVSTGTVSHDLNRFWHRVRGKEDPYLKVGESNDRSSKGESDYVWALKDINLEVKRGDRIGIIGRNGAGKSTLLKILSQVTGPTTGRVKMKGRVGSLLEVGTGFHPELTGRENIYMNGTILGMKRWEVKKKLDEIVDFAGVERYLDTPVKRYSSGMTVRLGFAVAAHLEPDILIVDEVLAVGDAEFQKKAIGKMKDVSEGEGRTILFVSHNMNAVKSLCKKGILLKNGIKYYENSAEKCVHKYLHESNNKSQLNNYISTSKESQLFKNGQVELLNLGIKAACKEYNEPILIDDEINFNLEYKQFDIKNILYFVFVLKDDNGNSVFSSSYGKLKNNKDAGHFKVKAIIPNNFLNSGYFSIDLYLIENARRSVFVEKDIISFNVIDNKKVGDWMGREPGPIHPQLTWEKKNALT